MQDRRRFSRFAFDTGAVLQCPPGGVPVRVRDLCLQGALLAPEADWQPHAGTGYRLTIELSPEARVVMQLDLVHWNRQQAGFRCLRLDLDSLIHLRRLAELNLGDAELLQRELAELVR